MKVMPGIRLGAVCALLGLSSGTALADATATLNISGVAFSVSDLTPDDGVAATATILSTGTRLYSSTGYNPYQQWDGDPYDLSPATSISTSVSSQGSQSAGHIDATTGVFSSSASFDHAYLEAARTEPGYWGNSAGTSGEYYFQFSLAPHSSVSFGGNVTIGASYDETPLANMGMVVGGRYILQLIRLPNPYNPVYVDRDEGNFWAQPEGEMSHDFDLSYANVTDSAQNMRIRVWSTVVASEQRLSQVPTNPIPVPEVPEPATYGMFAAGALVLLGARRRKLN